jgi:hypothetical protein
MLGSKKPKTSAPANDGEIDAPAGSFSTR